MAEERLPKVFAKSRGREIATPSDFKVRGTSQIRDAEFDTLDDPEMNEVDLPHFRRAEAKTELTRRDHGADQPARHPLDEIATLLQRLTYGAMMQLSDALWKNQPDGVAVTEANLPALLHRWAKSHSAG